MKIYRPKIYAKYGDVCKRPYGEDDKYSEMCCCPYSGGAVKETNRYYCNDVGYMGECDYLCDKHGIVGYYQYGFAEIAPTTFRQYIINPLRSLWVNISHWWRMKFRKNTSQLTEKTDDLPF